MPEERRASPDALLTRAKREGRGRLKIFLGAAPGVGKTYAMLAAARSELQTGRDIVVGLIETHGRAETEALVEGFEILQRKPVVYQNRVMHEFDLDAAIAREPQLILVDEYAHTNVPGGRHPKRWQDIEELLSLGVDVWTTLNVQHLESLNDVIQKITKVRVRETVPDRVFEQANEIALIDLPPDELLKRLASGKVYFQDTAAQAAANFFKLQNLKALRELALRRAAESVDADLVGDMQAGAIEGPWAAGERILACIGADESAQRVVRAAKRLADLMDAPWIVATVERSESTLDPRQRRNIDEALKLAESLGADTKTLVGNDLPGEIVRFASFENVTQIVIGRKRERFLAVLLRRSLPHEVLRRSGDIAVHLVSVDAEQPSGRQWQLPELPWSFAPYAWSTVAVAGAVIVGLWISTITQLPNLSMAFLLAVLFSAVSFGIVPAIYASAISFLAYNFFFIEPTYTFTIAAPHELFALVVFLAVAVLTSALAGRVREQAKASAIRTLATRRLYDFTRKLSGLASFDAIAEAAATEIHSSIRAPAVILLGEASGLKLAAAWPPLEALDLASMSAARWAAERDEPSGAGTATLPTVAWLFVPLRTPRDRVGVVGVLANAVDTEARTLLDTLVEQTAAALERANMGGEIVHTKAAAETEKVRNTLLASISHDFRTPLASILGSATSILDYGGKLDENAKRELLIQIKNEATHLDVMVRNLLSITRIDAGGLELRKDWVDLREVIDRVVASARRAQPGHRIDLSLPPDLPLVRADALLTEQAIGNVVQNAVSHTPPSTLVLFSAEVAADRISIMVTDDGPGIAKDELGRVFDKFVSTLRPGSPRASSDGVGLGLAIAKGIMNAHGGSIDVVSPVKADRGAMFTLAFPRAEQVS